MLKIIMLFMLLFAMDAFAQIHDDSNECLLKCGNVENYLINKIHCRRNCKNKPEICSENCNTTKKFIPNEDYCNSVCYASKPDICKKDCITDDDLDTNYQYCVIYCNARQHCSTKCDYDSYISNKKFCGKYCFANSTEICEETCSTYELVLSATNCDRGCSRYFSVICERNCTSPEQFLSNYNFCMEKCEEVKLNLCINLCDTADLFNENYDFCFNSCDFPEEFCYEKCFSVKNFTLNDDFCYRGCSYLGEDICENDCKTPENKMDNTYCKICTTKPPPGSFGGGLLPYIEIRPKTCISLLCG